MAARPAVNRELSSTQGSIPWTGNLELSMPITRDDLIFAIFVTCTLMLQVFFAAGKGRLAPSMMASMESRLRKNLALLEKVNNQPR